MSDQTNIPANQLQDQIAPIQNMDQFAMLMSVWFDNNHKQARQMLEVPDGQPVSIGLEPGAEPEELVLTGDLLKGFKAGIIAMTHIFGELPFGAAPAPTETVVATQEELDAALAAKKPDEPSSGN